ncbi:MAG: hypothetical protein AB7Q81_24355 [Gammaproteobacteria bacterium]
MARYMHPDVYDGASNVIKNNATKLTICETQPASFAEANTAKGGGGKKLAEYTVDSADFTLANGDVSGRKVTVAAQTGNNVSVSGDGDHIALLDVANSKLLNVTVCTLQTLTAGNPVNTAAYDIEFEAPTAPA